MDNRTIEQVRANEDRLIDKNIRLEQENQKLKEKVNRYEKPDDLTLFYMWLDTKAKDKLKQLENDNAVLKANLIQVSDEQRDLYKSIIDEVREHIEKHKFAYVNPLTQNIYNVSRCDEILEILDKAYRK